MSKCYLRYDTSRINSDIPIDRVIEYYAGISVNSTRQNIHCPSVNHKDDKNPSAKIYYDTNSCHCFACNKSFTPISLCREYFPELSFPQICKKLLDDFSLSEYDYSNKAEVEKINNARSANKYVDTFPLSPKELDIIGIKNTPVEKTYAVSKQYFLERFEGIIDFEYSALYSDDLKKKLVELSYGEAVEAELIEPNENERYIQEHEYFQMESIQQLWKENKKSIEAMLENKCNEKLDEYSVLRDDARQIVDEYDFEYDMESLKTRYEKIIKFISKYSDPSLGKQMCAAKIAKSYSSEKINAAQKKIDNVIDICSKYDNAKKFALQYTEKTNEIEEILSHLKEHQHEREAHTQEEMTI